MNSYRTLTVCGRQFGYYALASLGIELSAIPFSIRILLESVLRNCDGFQITEQDVKNLAGWTPDGIANIEIPFKPARVLLQDFTGVPAVVDLAAMRSAMKRLGGDPDKINPSIPVDLVIDHSIQTDFYGCREALAKNVDLEFHRNTERYALLRWAQQSLNNFRVIPPSVGIIHQVNLEFLADVVHQSLRSGCPNSSDCLLYPDSVLGTDSHTVMINGLGVLGWGVGGIEAEAVMLGQPYYMLAPQVVGFELTGSLQSGVTATDLVLTVTEILRKEGVVGKFVEYFGSGASAMPLADRAVLANMAPEYGATMGFFPVDAQTLRFLRETGRDSQQVEIIETYCKEQSLFNSPEQPLPKYSKILTLDLSTVQPSLAGPKRPQDRVTLSAMKENFSNTLTASVKDRGFGLSVSERNRTGSIVYSVNEDQTNQDHSTTNIPARHGIIVIASITSCTNTSNPHLMIAAGLLAKKAVEKGLRVPRFVKTSLAPGSRVVADYLAQSGLDEPLKTLGFHIVGYGCMTCIGNSGSLPPQVEKAVVENNLVAVAVLSGNRNFEGRINPFVKANYLASPLLVVAYALAGYIDCDLTTEPLGNDQNGTPIFLHDILPTEEEIAKVIRSAVNPEIYRNNYKNVFDSNKEWNAIPNESSKLFRWDTASTYIQEPPFLMDMTLEPPAQIPAIERARCLATFGDSVTTDHISPAGSIKPDSPAGKFLIAAGIPATAFNSYGSRRGNDRIMSRGTFANIRIRNLLIPGTEGAMTKHFPSGQMLPIYDAAVKYRETATPLIVLAGAEYGTGSSRDWAAKGTALLGVKAVIASGFERIHRGNLVGMGVLPLEFVHGATWQSLNLTGEEEFTIPKIGNDFVPGSEITVKAEREVKANLFSETEFQVKVRIDTPVELQYYLNGGILQTVLRNLAAAESK
ncbi:MAG: aconitate hydratase AcnA [Planctomycetaceae bacterium]|jgi:aconitate hydratase|nr:aconitate hydratase AcnA [Planctomycetaceae bacterium]